jgi:hypothetical protein
MEHTPVPSDHIHRIIALLMRNRHILREIAGNNQNHVSVAIETLQQHGFTFEYHTHCAMVEGTTVTCCFDYCYYRVNEYEVGVGRCVK